ncbi:MAG: alpha/beta hydrolase family protein [Limisphaerales bacterium]
MRYLAAILIGGLLFNSTPVSGAEWKGKASTWKGYQRFAFEVDGKACHVTLPKKPAAGKPWVWRARFPNYHPEADLLLLERGFHIGFINTGGMLGSPRALDHWDKFYEFMAKERGMAKKVALEAVSRGGLFAYRWAARHPDRVACIYADVPVCDFKSWPLKRGNGGDKLWQHLLKEYGLTHEQALNYRENPIDVLAPLAKAKIPLLHLITLNDKIVPPEENTFVLAKRYRKLGGQIDLIEVKEGTEKSSGHHCTHPDPKRAADFIAVHVRKAIPKPLSAFHRRIGHSCALCLPPLP